MGVSFEAHGAVAAISVLARRFYSISETMVAQTQIQHATAPLNLNMPCLYES